MTVAPRLGMLPRVTAQRSVAFLSAFVLAAVLGGGCASGTETGNPSLTGSLSYTGYSSAPDAYGVTEGGRIATVERAWFALDQVTVFDGVDRGCEGTAAEAFVAPALGIGDHAAGNHNFTAFSAEPGSFCSVELPFVPVPPATPSVPEELVGHALLLDGKLADGTPFRIVSDETPRVQLSAADESGFQLASSDADLLIAFDFATWLSGVDFSAAEIEADGAIEISERRNPALLASFEQQLAAGVRLYRDRDADGIVDEDPELLAESR